MERWGLFTAFALIAAMGGLVAMIDGPAPSRPRGFEGVSGQQNLLREDMARVDAYVRAPPERWAGIRFENEPVVRIVVGFTADLEGHRRALHALVDHPDRVEVVPARRSHAELARIRAAIEPEVFRPGGPGVSLGEAFDTLVVRLRADGEELAASLRARYGDALEITVGRNPYPPVAEAPGTCPRITSGEWDDVEVRLVLRERSLRAGTNGSATLTIRNRSPRRLELESAQPLLASVLEPGGDRIVGSYTGPVAGTGLLLRLAPGQETEIPVFVGTASCDGTRYAVAPGRYGVRVAIRLREGDVEHRVVSPEVPIVLE